MGEIAALFQNIGTHGTFLIFLKIAFKMELIGLAKFFKKQGGRPSGPLLFVTSSLVNNSRILF